MSGSSEELMSNAKLVRILPTVFCPVCGNGVIEPCGTFSEVRECLPLLSNNGSRKTDTGMDTPEGVFVQKIAHRDRIRYVLLTEKDLRRFFIRLVPSSPEAC
jgi:hypothetical protein